MNFISLFSKYPHWPGKLMLFEGGHQAIVYFFADNKIGKVDLDSCYLYSEEDPNEDVPDQYKDDIRRAMNVRVSHCERTVFIFCYIIC